MGKFYIKKNNNKIRFLIYFEFQSFGKTGLTALRGSHGPGITSSPALFHSSFISLDPVGI